MIVSMTGFGKASRTVKKISINVEMRSINSKYLEIAARLPVIFSDKEGEIKDIVGKKVSRGKINIAVSVERNSSSGVVLQIQPEVLKDYYALLSQMKKTINLKEDIKIEHLLKFSEIFKVDENNELKEYWEEVKKVIQKALDDLYRMKKSEGKMLEKDILKRVNLMQKNLEKIVRISTRNISDAKQKLHDKILRYLSTDSSELVDKNRLEFELVMLTDKMDITEEVTRANSHIEYFKRNMKDYELSGRRLNFLVQEINREINTIASKSSSSTISQNVVEMKEELEKIKEQLQNVE
jgi:uncharacterized protein (TIGR00255 family)